MGLLTAAVPSLETRAGGIEAAWSAQTMADFRASTVRCLLSVAVSERPSSCMSVELLLTFGVLPAVLVTLVLDLQVLLWIVLIVVVPLVWPI